MKKTSIKTLALLLCIGMLTALLAACGASAAKGDTKAGTDKNLSADQAYQAAVSAEEGEECTSDECVVTLYDDTDDNGDYPYYVLSPLGAVVGK